MGCGAVHPPHHFHHPLVSPLHRPHYSLSNHQQTLDLDLLTINQMNLSRPLVSPSLVPPSPVESCRSRARAPINLALDIDLGQRSSSFPSVQFRSKRHIPNMKMMVMMMLMLLMSMLLTLLLLLLWLFVPYRTVYPVLPYPVYIIRYSFRTPLPSPPGLAPNLVHH